MMYQMLDHSLPFQQQYTNVADDSVDEAIAINLAIEMSKADAEEAAQRLQAQALLPAVCE